MAAEHEKLRWALQNGDEDCVKAMLKSGGVKGKEGFNVKINGRSPLHIAADYGHLCIIDFLLENGADINSKDTHGITPLLAAVYEGHKECIKTLLSKGADKDGKAPDGRSYIECAENEQVKSLLK